MNATITFGTAEQARFLADMPQLTGNGFYPQVDGAKVTLDTRALGVLMQLSEDNDGHFDGTHVWIGGSEYRAVRHTGRPAKGREVKTRLTDDEIIELERLAKDQGIDRSDLIARWVRDGLASERLTAG